MSEFSLKIQVGEACVELQGDAASVKEIFREIRDLGLGTIPSVKKQMPLQINEKTTDFITTSELLCDNEHSESFEYEIPDEYKYPSIHEVTINKYPNDEVEWVLVYAFYASGYGQKEITSDDIKGMYNITKRVNGSRYKQLESNLRVLVQNKKISVTAEKMYRILQPGVKTVSEILSREPKPAKANVNSGSRKANSPQYIELGLSEEILSDIIENYKEIRPKTNIDKVFLLCYLAQKYGNINEVDNNIIFTLLDNVDEKTDIDIEGTIRNLRNKNYNLLQSTDEKGKYKLTDKSKRYYSNLVGE